MGGSAIHGIRSIEKIIRVETPKARYIRKLGLGVNGSSEYSQGFDSGSADDENAILDLDVGP